MAGDTEDREGEGYPLAYEAVRQKAPSSSGVYRIYSPARWIYVGESDDIRQRLYRHLNESDPSVDRFGSLSFSFERVALDGRMARWQALVTELEPVCNQAGNHPSTTAA